MDKKNSADGAADVDETPGARRLETGFLVGTWPSAEECAVVGRSTEPATNSSETPTRSGGVAHADE